MIYLNNNTSAQTINIPYSQPDIPVTKEVQSQKDFTVTERGQYNINPDSGFSSMEKVHLTVDTPNVQEAFESGQTYQKSLMIGANITENGEYVRPDGYSAVSVNINSSFLVSTSADTGINVQFNTSPNKNELQFGVAFQEISDDGDYVFLSFGSVDFCVTTGGIWVEHKYWPGEDPEWDEIDLFRSPTTGTLYNFTVKVNSHNGKIEINGESFEIAQPEVLYGNIILQKHSNTEYEVSKNKYDIRYLDYYTENDVKTLNLTQVPGGYYQQTIPLGALSFGKYLVSKDIMFSFDLDQGATGNKERYVVLEIIPKHTQRVWEVIAPNFGNLYGDITSINQNQNNGIYTYSGASAEGVGASVTGGTLDFTTKSNLPLIITLRYNNMNFQTFVDSKVLYYYLDSWGYSNAYKSNHKLEVWSNIKSVGQYNIGGQGTGNAYIRSITIIDYDRRVQIMVRSDGKLCDAVTNTELVQNDSRFYNFRWTNVAGGAVPTTFESAYEWEIQ